MVPAHIAGQQPSVAGALDRRGLGRERGPQPVLVRETGEILAHEVFAVFPVGIREQAGAATALYMVWPSQARRGDFPDVSRSYATATRAVGGLLLPAGDAWREAWQLDSRLALYGSDGFHPSPLGSELAAITIFQAVTGQPPAILPFENLTPAQAAAFRQAATTALAKRP